METTDLKTQFETTGVVRLENAFDPSAMRRTIWAYAADRGLVLDDPSTWPEGWPGISWKGLKRKTVFLPFIDNPAVTGALDTIFGVGGWKHPRAGAQILVTFPKPGPWALTDGWHMDTGFERASFPTYAVKLFAFFARVEPQGGGTMALPGTHLVVDRYRETIPPGTGSGKVNWLPFMNSHPALAQLLRGASMPDFGRSLVGQTFDVDGIPIEVLEMTGEPGDVFITHLHVFHAASHNASHSPRQMLGQAVSAVEPA